MSTNLNATSTFSPSYQASHNSTILLVSRILLAGVFLVFGIRKLMAVAGTAGYLTKLGLPMGDILVWAVILIEVGGALLLIVGWQTRLAAWILAGFVVLATLAAHRYWEFEGPQYVAQLTNFMKNLAIVGGLLLVAASGPGRMSVDRS
ncbi:MAG TPA: DoxX family protein [Caulobacteraceae bacterium]|nr:DoxX family protein [Caulobacteraceae bacterium]